MVSASNRRHWLLLLLVLCLTYLAGTASVDYEGNSTFYEHNAEAPAEDAPAISKRNSDIFQRALQKAIGGGIPGAIAGVVQVLALMWLRTVINYQYRYGSTFIQSLTHLYTTGGLTRLYSGLPFALIQAPLVRFVSTAANDGVSLFLQNNPYTERWGPAKEVAVAAVVVGLFRGMLMPIDTCKTVLQIEGGWGFERLIEKVRKGDIGVLYSGAVANAISSFIGHYPWFYTYNLLSRSDALIAFIPLVNSRNAFIGFVSSIVSDTVANFMRVIKTTKQALAARGDDEDLEYGRARSITNGFKVKRTTYAEVIGIILAADGWRGLFGRGLKTRIFANALQSIVFTVIWRGLSDTWSAKNNQQQSSPVELADDKSSNEIHQYNMEKNDLEEAQ